MSGESLYPDSSSDDDSLESDFNIIDFGGALIDDLESAESSDDSLEDMNLEEDLDPDNVQINFDDEDNEDDSDTDVSLGFNQPFDVFQPNNGDPLIRIQSTNEFFRANSIRGNLQYIEDIATINSTDTVNDRANSGFAAALVGLVKHCVSPYYIPMSNESSRIRHLLGDITTFRGEMYRFLGRNWAHLTGQHGKQLLVQRPDGTRLLLFDTVQDCNRTRIMTRREVGGSISERYRQFDNGDVPSTFEWQ